MKVELSRESYFFSNYVPITIGQSYLKSFVDCVPRVLWFVFQEIPVVQCNILPLCYFIL